MKQTYGLMSLIALLVVGCARQDSVSVSQTTTDGQRSVTVTKTVETQHATTATAEELAAKARETADLAGELAAQTKDEFIAAAKERLVKIDQRINEWDAQSALMSAEAKVRWNEERERLRQHQAEMQLELERLQKASGEAWGDLKAGATAAWKELASGFNSAAARFDQDRKKDAANEP